jgi:hypothetical protein
VSPPQAPALVAAALVAAAVLVPPTAHAVLPAVGSGCRFTLTGGPRHEGVVSAGPLVVTGGAPTYALLCEFHTGTPTGPLAFTVSQPNAGPVAVLVHPDLVTFSDGTPGVGMYLCTFVEYGAMKVPQDACTRVFTN